MMETKDYRRLAARLRQYASIRGQARSAGGPDGSENLELQAADAIEELLGAIEKETVVRVETPLGMLTARPWGDPQYPGIRIGISGPDPSRELDTDKDLELTVVEFTDSEPGLPSAGRIVSRVYGDALSDEHTDKIIHKKIEDCFRSA